MSEKLNYFSLITKLILSISIIFSINSQLWHLASTQIFLLILMFSPQILNKYYKIKFPKEFEVILIIFVVITIFLSKTISFLAPIFFGIGTGLVGLVILFLLYSTNQIKRNLFLITFFSFAFSLTFGLIVELMKFYLKYILSHTLAPEVYSYTMLNLTYVLMGGLIASLTGLYYMKTRIKPIGNLIKKFKKTNKNLFKKKTAEEILELIDLEESENLEFKSSLRYNFFTKEKDKSIEESILKTICGFLNKNGGTLLVGVTDDKKIIGIENDDFKNSDKFILHLLNLIKTKLGKSNLNILNIEPIKVDKKVIIKVDAGEAKKPVFMKKDLEELFFVRSGPQTVELKGPELIDYVKKRFEKE